MGGALYDKRVVFDWEGPYKRGTTKYFCVCVILSFYVRFVMICCYVL